MKKIINLGNYLTTDISVGDGWTSNDEAARRWNEFIAPVLRTALRGRNDIEADLKWDADWAWDEFCSREAGESDELAAELGEELYRKLCVENY